MGDLQFIPRCPALAKSLFFPRAFLSPCIWAALFQVTLSQLTIYIDMTSPRWGCAQQIFNPPERGQKEGCVCTFSSSTNTQLCGTVILSQLQPGAKDRAQARLWAVCKLERAGLFPISALPTYDTENTAALHLQAETAKEQVFSLRNI